MIQLPAGCPGGKSTYTKLPSNTQVNNNITPTNQSNQTHPNPTTDSFIMEVPSIPPLRLEDLAVSPSISPIAVANPFWLPHSYLEEDIYPILQRVIDRIPP